MTGPGAPLTPRLIVFVVTAVLLLLPTSPAVGVPAEPACTCANVVAPDGRPLQVPAGRQVVLLIHGFLQNPSKWFNDDFGNEVTGSLAQTLKADNNYTLALLDYGKVDVDWVEDAGPNGEPSIAQKLAAAIICLAKKSGRKASLVSYSLGGFAAEQAVGGEAGHHVAGLVAVATPWQGLTVPVPVAGPPTCVHQAADKCSFFDIPRTEAAEAMENADTLRQFRNQYPIPASIEVVPVAGTNRTVNIFGVLRQLAEGDILMSPDSAKQPPAKKIVDPSGQMIDAAHLAPTIACYTIVQLPGVGAPVISLPASGSNELLCWHGEILRHPDLVPIAQPALERWRKAAGTSATAGTGCQPASQTAQPAPPVPMPAPTPTKPKPPKPEAKRPAARLPFTPTPGVTPPQPRPAQETQQESQVPQPKQAAPKPQPQEKQSPPKQEVVPKLAPYASLSPESGPPGTIVNASGGGWSPNKAVTVTQSGSNATGGGGSIKADANGDIDSNFRIADGTEPGTLTITFRQGSSVVTVHFEVE
jgi:pimeloyl-ACP methyl ester carboxylesterase